MPQSNLVNHRSSSALRSSGVSLLGEIPWGSHICQFYKTEEELLEILVPYFKAGLEANEACILVVSGSLSPDRVKKALQGKIPDLTSYLENGQLEIFPYDKWYLEKGKFDKEKVLKKWLKKLDNALARGFDGLRVSGSTSWLGTKNKADFSLYEAKIEAIVEKFKILVLCNYPLANFSGEEIADVINNHQKSIIKKNGKWILVQSDQIKKAQTDKETNQDQVKSALTKKVESLLANVEKRNDFRLSDIVDVQEVQSLVEDFHAITGIPMALIDLKGEVVVGVGWQDICTRFHRIHPKTCQHCLESDLELTKGIPPGEFRIYRCKNGMWDMATPLVVGGKKVGNLFCGQIFFSDETVDIDFFKNQAKKYGFSEDEYLTSLAKVPRINKENLEVGLSFYRKLASNISKLSYGNVALTRSVIEKENLMKSVNETAGRLKKAERIARLGSWELDLSKNKLTWSDEVYRIFGLKPREFPATYEAFLERIHPEDREIVDKAYNDSLVEGEKGYEIEHRIIQRNGKVRWVHEKCQHFRNKSGKIIKSTGMVHDITERKEAEQQKDDFIGVASHELKTPLSTVKGYSQLLEK